MKSEQQMTDISIDNSLLIDKELLNFKNQKLVDDIFESLSKENKIMFKQIYDEVTQRNKQNINNYLNKFIAAKYKCQNLFSDLWHLLFSSICKTLFMLFIQLFVLRYWEVNFNLVKKILDFAHNILGNGFFYINYDFNIDAVSMELPTGPEGMPSFLCELSLYFSFIFIVWIIINLIFYVFSQKKHKKNDSYILSLKESLKTLQCDEFDSLNYMKYVLSLRYNKNVTNTYLQKRYVQAYANIISQHNFINKLYINEKQKEKIIIKTCYRGIQNIIGLISYTLLIMFGLVMILVRFGPGLTLIYNSFPVSFIQNIFVFFAKITTFFNFNHLYYNFCGDEPFILGTMDIIMVFIVFIFIKNISKRVAIPTYREYCRFCLLTTKINKELVPSDTTLKNSSQYLVFTGLFFVLIVPAIIIFFILNS